MHSPYMTTLARYLATHRLTEAKFAVQIGMSRISVNHWVNQRSIPRREMTAIFNATEGEVRPEDLRRRRSR